MTPIKSRETERTARNAEGVDPTLIEQAKSLYRKTFGESSHGGHIICTAAPGRVNLIGEHVDYTGGFVLPMAIGFHTICYGFGSMVEIGENSCVCRFVSTVNPDDVQTFEYPPKKNDIREGEWSNYVKGVVAQYMDHVPNGYTLNFEIAISSNVPLGSGLSSSAALEVSVARFVEEIVMKQNNALTKEAKVARALKCQKAENEWCNSPCGIMDQFVSSAGEMGAVLLIDCESTEYEAYSFGGNDEEEKPTVVICNSNVTHSIGGGEYPIRVKQCAKALEAVNTVRKVKSLRHATMKDIEESRDSMDELIYRRARHVISENERTKQAAEALKMGNYEVMGRLMNESHSSMRDDYEVSCSEIDALVDLAQVFSPQDAVYGSRLTGGGFGGCTVSLVRPKAVPAFIEHMKEEYTKWQQKRNGSSSSDDILKCTCFVTTPASGVQLLHLS
eukprot:CAMPEP_0194367630 /NCGR_PEP_ID=MMETSP0174-20130528/15751_1 /TAXON_ID=216777 /ORGANISM="Proboscia alata, Strain PI-D3" /LENGTH=445 /DNA_ID=CAMNT_0039143503 /DNA_START=167 /DNA_END=1504 /DNA_ORIENTATION=-